LQNIDRLPGLTSAIHCLTLC